LRIHTTEPFPSPNAPLNLHQLLNILFLHFAAGPSSDHFTPLHHQMMDGQFFGKVLVLLGQQNGHALALQAHIGQQSDQTALSFCSGTTNFTRVPGWVVDKVRWLFDALSFPPVARARAIMLV
jgi:hypothetical protein